MLMKQLFLFRVKLAREAEAARLNPLPGHDPRFEPIGHIPKSASPTPCAIAHSGTHGTEVIQLPAAKQTTH